MMMAWGAKRVPVDIEVKPSFATIAAELATPYVGSREVGYNSSSPEPGESVPFNVTYTGENELHVQTIFPTPEGVAQPGCGSGGRGAGSDIDTGRAEHSRAHRAAGVT